MNKRFLLSTFLILAASSNLNLLAADGPEPTPDPLSWRQKIQKVLWSDRSRRYKRAALVAAASAYLVLSALGVATVSNTPENLSAQEIQLSLQNTFWNPENRLEQNLAMLPFRATQVVLAPVAIAPFVPVAIVYAAEGVIGAIKKFSRDDFSA